MVISVFPDYGQAIDRYRSVRNERLERQAQQAQQATFNRMLQGIEDPQQRAALETMGPQQGATAFVNMRQQQEAARAEAERERRAQINEYGNSVATRLRVMQGQEGFDPETFLSEAYANGQSQYGMQMPFDQFARLVSNPMAGELPDQGSDLPAGYRSRHLRAVAGGLEPGTPEYQEFMLQSSAPTTTITNAQAAQPLTGEERARYGIPEDDRRPYILRLRGDQLVPEPVDVNMPDAEEPIDMDTLRLNELQIKQYGDAQLEDLETALQQVDTSILPATGLGSGLAGRFRGTAAANVGTLLDSITGAVALERLENMRNIAAEAGQRGSGLGQVTQRELDILRAARGALSQEQDPELFMRQARRLLSQLREVRAERERILQRDFPEVYQDFYGGAEEERSEADEAMDYFLNQGSEVGPN